MVKVGKDHLGIGSLSTGARFANSYMSYRRCGRGTFEPDAAFTFHIVLGHVSSHFPILSTRLKMFSHIG